MTKDKASATSQASATTPVINDISGVSDHVSSLKRLLWVSIAVVAVILVVSAAAWWFAAGLPGVYGALIGGVVGGGFMIVTVAIMIATSGMGPNAIVGVVLGSWLVKAVILLILLVVLKDLTFYNRYALGVTVIVTLTAALALESITVMRSQKLYIS